MSVNKVILMGNVGKDPQVRDVSGVKVASFTLATTDRAYTKSTGEQVPERTEWHNVVVWRKLAEVVERYVRKGTKLYIEGKLTTRSYDKDGIKRYVTEIVVDNLELLGDSQKVQQQAQQPVQQQYQQPAYQPAPQPAPMPTEQPAYRQPQQYQQQFYQPQPQTQPQYQQGPGVDNLPF